jgi:hypothetical protein
MHLLGKARANGPLRPKRPPRSVLGDSQIPYLPEIPARRGGFTAQACCPVSRATPSRTDESDNLLLPRGNTCLPPRRSALAAVNSRFPSGYMRLAENASFAPKTCRGLSARSKSRLFRSSLGPQGPTGGRKTCRRNVRFAGRSLFAPGGRSMLDWLTKGSTALRKDSVRLPADSCPARIAQLAWRKG